MDPQTLVPWLSAGALIISILTSLYTFLTRGSQENAESIAKVTEKLTEHDRRIQAVEGEIKHLPDKDMVTELKIAMAELKGTVGTLGESMNSIARTVRRIEDYLQEKT